MDAFRLDGPRPEGTLVLEASAGTGKTYTIAGLAARYVAEGVPLERLLLITFTRMATSELRERVRQRLREVLDGLRGAETTDAVVALLARGDRERHAENLERALADFDAATIATTHGFCDEMLGGLGVAADVEPDRVFVEDVRDLRAQVVDDLFVWRVASRAAGRPPSYEQAKEIARAAVDNPETELAPHTTPMGETRWRTADWTRRELAKRKERMKLVTFDDLQLRLRDALERNPLAVEQLRDRYDVVLVDEFQDTDPVQWEILDTAFSGRTLVLIGDPKQAIYAFRGADVFAYLQAAGRAQRQTLDRNHRSDKRLIDAYDALFGDARLGDDDIAYLNVTAEHERPRLRGTPADAALRLRVALRRNMPDTSSYAHVRAGEGREHIARDLAADIVGLLSCGTAEIERAPGDWTRVAPGDVAVLVRTNRHAALVRDALEDAGVPAVINGAGSVFGSDTALKWLRLLEALERPSHRQRARLAALTCFFGWDATRAALATDEQWEREVHDRLHAWAHVLRTSGVASLVEAITFDQGLFGRVLAVEGGERDLTDVRHVGQLLHGAAVSEHLGTTALAAWLRRRVAEAADDTTNEERSRRLESDEDAVQVLTVHRSKGLEFGVVYLPFAWSPVWQPDAPPPVVFHEGTERVLDVTLEGDAYERHREAWRAEERGEDLRLLYVALTRARHQAVVWWAGSKDACASSLGRLLFGRGPGGTVADLLPRTPEDTEAAAALVALRDRAGGTIALERALPPAAPVRWSPPAAPRRALERARFDRAVDQTWRRTSYSALTAAAHEAAVTSEPETPVTEDEPEAPAVDAAPEDGPWAGVPVGTRTGTIVHRALEQVDFTRPEFGPEVTELGAVAGLRAALAAPLGEAFGGVRLADLARGDRLDELEFELPLAAGRLGRLAALLREHGDPYGERLAELDAPLHGFLTGSLDLVARLPDGRYAVLDYKTNRLDDYGPGALAAEMEHRHYGLQALLYVVALHRYLRWRLPGYDPRRQLAGAGYLFLRGMTGAAGAGVYAWCPPAELVEGLSGLLDG